MESKNIIFSVEKVKELTKSIGIIQGKLNTLKTIYDNFNRDLKSVIEESIDENRGQLLPIEDLNDSLKLINAEILKFSDISSENWLFFKDLILSEYKNSIEESLLKRNLNADSLRKIGIELIKNKKTSSLLDLANYITSIDLKYWALIVDSLKNNSYFLTAVDRAKKYYQNEIERLLRIELKKIPRNFNGKLKAQFKKEFTKNKISFEDFVLKSKSVPPQKKIKKKPEVGFAKKKIGQTKTSGRDGAQFKSYDTLFNLSDEEFQRLKRKKTRKKLDALSKEKKATDSLKEEKEKVLEDKKIETSIEGSQTEGELLEEEDSKQVKTDPLEIIRERKKTKQEEFDEHLDRIKKSKKRGKG